MAPSENNNPLVVDPPRWSVRLLPEQHPLESHSFDVVVGADGRRNSLPGFKRKEFRGRLAIGITANFVNYHSAEEAEVQERSGVAFIFDQKFFLDLRDETGIDLENIVYYKDDTHYFVMTAKKQSLIEKGVIKKVIYKKIKTMEFLSNFVNINDLYIHLKGLPGSERIIGQRKR